MQLKFYLVYGVLDGSRSDMLLTRFDNALTGINDAHLLYNSAARASLAESSEDQCIGSCMDTTNCGAAFVAFSDVQGQTFQWCALLNVVDMSPYVFAIDSSSWSQSWGSSMPQPVSSSLIILGMVSNMIYQIVTFLQSENVSNIHLHQKCYVGKILVG